VKFDSRMSQLVLYPGRARFLFLSFFSFFSFLILEGESGHLLVFVHLCKCTALVLKDRIPPCMYELAHMYYLTGEEALQTKAWRTACRYDSALGEILELSTAPSSWKEWISTWDRPWKSLGSLPGPSENANVQTASADLSV